MMTSSRCSDVAAAAWLRTLEITDPLAGRMSPSAVAGSRFRV